MYTDFDVLTNDFVELKKKNDVIVDLLKDDFLLSEKAEKISVCGDFLGFSPSSDTGEFKLVSANFCRERLCPTCQKRKSLKMYANVLQVVNYIKTNVRNVRYLHLVLTVPNCDGGVVLNSTISKLFKSFGKFYKYKDIQRAFKGCLRCLEITYNSDTGMFHPHLHCLIAVNGSYFNSRYYLKYDRLQELWTKANNSDVPLQISVGSIKGDIAKGVAEVCKYCVKPLEYGELDDTTAQYVLRTIGLVLKGQRCIQKYGIIKEAFKALDIDDDDDEQDFCEMPTEVFYYGYDRKKGKYFSINK